MGLETATYISGLNANNPVNATDVVGEGDDHLRLIKSTLLNSFPGITGEMSLTHAQLNAAAVKSEENVFTARQRISHASEAMLEYYETDAGADEKLWRTIANLDSFIFQTRTDADALGEAFLTVSRTGVAVTSIAMNADDIHHYPSSGVVTVHSAGNTDTEARQVQLTNLAGTVRGRIGYVSDGDLQIKNEVHGASVTLTAEDNGGTARNIISGDPDGVTQLYYQGSRTIQTHGSGVDLYDPSATSPFLAFRDSGATRLGFIQCTSTQFLLRSEMHGAPVVLQGEDASGVNKTIYSGDPDGGASIFYTGVEVGRTHAGGIHIADSTAGNDPFIGWYSQSFAARQAYIQANNASGLLILSEMHGLPVSIQGEDAGGTIRNIVVGDPDGSSALYYAGTSEISTQGHSASGATSGAQVKDHGATLRDIGFNVLAAFNENASDVLEAQHCGSMQYSDDANPYTLTLAAVADLDFPVGGVTHILNPGTDDYTITEGASTTLYYVDPGTGRTDTAGGCTIGPGGMATIWRAAAAVYYIWGSEITP